MTLPPEAPSRIEPCTLGETIPTRILDLVASLSAATAALGARLAPRTAASLADLVRIMNCYYSNLIEGHNTTPREIEAALRNAIEGPEDRRNLQREARAHTRLQQSIDRQHAVGTLPEPTTASFVQWLHREFYADASDAMLAVPGPNKTLRVTPGAFRTAPAEEVTVGRHQPPAPQAVPAFMAHFEQRYRTTGLGPGARIAAIPAAHHRLNYIHPFLDGTGRVSRLMSHAMALHAGIGAQGLWSVSRGLARGLESRGEYMRMMDHADRPRQGDLDGRGNLSLKALQDFTEWYLAVCLDQVAFMSGLFALETLASRLRSYASHRQWPVEAAYLLQHSLQQGAIPRGEAPRITGLKERSARTLLSTLLADGILASDTPKGPVFLQFSLDSSEWLFPALFPQL